MSQTMDQRKTNIGSVYRAVRDCTPVRTMTQCSVHVNLQSEMMSQHPTKSGSITVQILLLSWPYTKANLP